MKESAPPALRHLLKPMLKNYSTVPPDTVILSNATRKGEKKIIVSGSKINSRLAISTFPPPMCGDDRRGDVCAPRAHLHPERL